MKLFTILALTNFAHAQFYTTNEKKGERCPSLKNFVTDQITECILSCNEVDNATALYNDGKNICHCVAENCPKEKKISNENSTVYAYTVSPCLTTVRILSPVSLGF